MLNKCIFIGRLGKDPEVRVTQGGSKVANFSLAVSEKYKDQSGNQQESTEWVNVVLWKKQAEICEKYLKKGSQVYIEGKWKTQSWDDPNGKKVYKTELIGSHFLMLGSGSSGGQQQAPQNNSTQYEQAPQNTVPEYIPEEPPF